MQAEDIILPGTHNIENYMAAFAAVSGLVSYETMRMTAKNYRGVAHRIELVREHRAVRYYNDSIASSPSRAIAGIRALSADESPAGLERRNIILIAGGKDKGIPFDEFGTEIVACVKELVLTGVAANQILEAVEEAEGFNTPGCFSESQIHQCTDFKDAVKTAAALAKDGDIVLLSPACTSFDMFKNFEERGNTFKDIVNNLE